MSMSKKLILPFIIDFKNENIGIYTSSQLKQKWNNPLSFRGIEEGRFKVVKMDGEKVLQAKSLKGKV